MLGAFLLGMALWYILCLVLLIAGIRSLYLRRWLNAGALLVLFFGLYIAPSLVQLWEKRQITAAIDRAQVIGDLPDLTGKVVVLATGRDLDDPLLECETLMRFSGARIVYLTPPFRKDYDRDAVDLSVAVDLESLIVGRAQMVTHGDPGQSSYENCELQPGPVTEPPEYLLLSGAYNDAATRHFRDRLSAPALDGHHVSMLWYMAPITDPAVVLINEDQADLLLFQTDAIKPGFPYNPLISPDRIDVPDWQDQLEPLLRPVFCRHGDAQCYMQL